MEDPIAMLSERSILSLTETVTAVTCSAAFLIKRMRSGGQLTRTQKKE